MCTRGLTKNYLLWRYQEVSRFIYHFNIVVDFLIERTLSIVKESSVFTELYLLVYQKSKSFEKRKILFLLISAYHFFGFVKQTFILFVILFVSEMSSTLRQRRVLTEEASEFLQDLSSNVSDVFDKERRSQVSLVYVKKVIIILF